MYQKASDDPELRKRVKRIMTLAGSANKAAMSLGIGRPAMLAYDANRTVTGGTVAQIRAAIDGAEKALAKKSPSAKKEAVA